MKNIFLKIAVRFFNRFIPKHKENDKILIVSTTALGDTLWATPAIHNIKKTNPKTALCVLTSPIGKEVFKENPDIDQIFVLKPKSFFSLRKKLFKEGFSSVLLFHASQRLTLPLVSLIGASKIIGTKGINKGLDALLTHPLAPIKEHEILRRIKIAEKVGARPFVETLSFHLKEEELLPPLGKKVPWIALHPGSKDAFKRWDKQNFIDLAGALKNSFPCEIFITGTKEEKELIEEVQKAVPSSKTLPSGQTLREFAASLKQMDLLIANDTGPLHLACALSVPAIGIYSATDPALCGPHKAKEGHVVAKRTSCSPCLKRKCKLPFCLMQISVEDVLKKVKQMGFF